MKLSALVVGFVLAIAPAWGGQAAAPAKAKKSESTKKTAPSAPVDLNTGSAAELTSIPGIGDATAKKIMAGRPYSSVADLKKTGMSASQMSQISPMLTVKGVAPSATSTMNTPSGTKMAPSAPMSPAAASPRTPVTKLPQANGPTVPYQAPPSSGMVWVNKETKVYHKEGDRWYGRTKQGAYMNEADATKAGYRASKEK